MEEFAQGHFTLGPFPALRAAAQAAAVVDSALLAVI
jgi:hypothetical protein